MTSIKETVERLRNRPNDHPIESERLMDDAAALIERLAGALEGMMSLFDERFDLHTDEAVKAYADARRALSGEPT
jgi:hypothetical protein